VSLTLRPGALERASPAPAEIHYPDGSSRSFLDLVGILARLSSKKLRNRPIVDPRLFEPDNLGGTSPAGRDGGRGELR